MSTMGWRSLAIFPGAVFLLSLTFTHTVALRLITLFLFAAYVGFSWKSRSVPSTLLLGPVLAWAGLALLSLLWATNPSYSLNEIKNEILYTMVTFLTFFTITEDQQQWRYWNRVLILGFFLTTLSGILTYVMAPKLWQEGGIFGGVGEYSTYLITIFPVVLYWHLKRKQFGLPKIVLATLVPLLLVSAYLTSNRAFWPTLVGILIVFSSLYFFRSPATKAARLVALGSVILAAFAIFLFTLTLAQRSSVPGSGADLLVRTAENDPRLPIWEFSWEQIKQRPLTGVGFGRLAIREKMEQHFNNPGYEHSHNLILDYALQMGLGGAIVLILIFGSLTREYWTLYRCREADVSLIGILGLALLTGTLVKNTTDDFFVRHHALFFWALVGMSLGYGKRRRASFEDKKTSFPDGA